MVQPVYITLATHEYQDELKGWLESIHAISPSLEYVVHPGISTGDWCRNAQLKIDAIKAAMDDFSGRPIVWVDADARFCRQPVLFDHIAARITPVDFAAHWLHHKANDLYELLSGTLYFGATRNARSIVGAWNEKRAEYPRMVDQKILQRIVQDRPDWGQLRLPRAYCDIFDLPGRSEDPVIEHFQASRRLRREVNKPH